jgi:hypothetical protein
MLVTGNRISDSRILSTISFFDLTEKEHKTVKIEIKKYPSPHEILGIIDLKTTVLSRDNQQISLDSLIAKGIVISWIEPDKEPTKHIFNDLPLLKSELDNWGGQFVFLTTRTERNNSFINQSLSGLPKKTIFGIDEGSEILKKVSNNTSVSEIRLPYIILVNKTGNIIYKSEGYRIGIGEQILRKVNN